MRSGEILTIILNYKLTQSYALDRVMCRQHIHSTILINLVLEKDSGLCIFWKLRCLRSLIGSKNRGSFLHFLVVRGPDGIDKLLVESWGVLDIHSNNFKLTVFYATNNSLMSPGPSGELLGGFPYMINFGRATKSVVYSRPKFTEFSIYIFQIKGVWLHNGTNGTVPFRWYYPVLMNARD